MNFLDSLMQIISASTAAYIIIVLVYLYKKKSLSFKVEIKRSLDKANEKVDPMLDGVSSVYPTLDQIELETKKAYINFTQENILEKLQENGYKNSVIIGEGKIFTGVLFEINDEEKIQIGHSIILDTKNTSIMVESFCLGVEKTNLELYKEILTENHRVKLSGFGVETIEETTYIIAQTYFFYPKDLFHIAPLIQSLDFLEYAHIALSKKLKSLGFPFKNITFKQYLDCRLRARETLLVDVSKSSASI